MKVLKSMKDEKTIETIEDSDLIGLYSGDYENIIIISHNGEFIGLDKSDDNVDRKWSASTKRAYVERFQGPTGAGEVLLFDNELEMMLWYNNND